MHSKNSINQNFSIHCQSTSVSKRLALFLYFLGMVLTQTSPPDHYFDFTKISNVNGVDYVFDQITQDVKYSFGFLPPRTCPPGSVTFPQRGPDGLQFLRDTDSLRLENSNNMLFQSKWMIAAWVKVFQPTPNNYGAIGTFISERRYGQNNTYDPAYAFYIDGQNGGNTTLLAQINFQNSQNPGAPPAQQWPWLQHNTTIDYNGWSLLSVAVGVQSSINSVVVLRIRTPSAYDTQTIPYAGNIYMDSQYDPQNADTYISAFCQNNNSYVNGFIGTMGRMYIWKNYSNTFSDFQFNSFFFRNGNSYTPVCSGIYYCQFCVVDMPWPANFSGVVLPCPADSSPANEVFLAYWDMDSGDASIQYIVDQSGNNRDFMKIPVSDYNNTDPWRIYGQGYLFDSNMFVMTSKAIPFSYYAQWSIDFWFRKPLHFQTGSNSNPYGMVLIVQDLSLSTQYMYITIDDINAYFQYYFAPNGGQTYNLPGVSSLTSQQWHYFSFSFTQFYLYNQPNYNIFIQYDNNSQTIVQQGQANFNSADDNTTFDMYFSRSFIFNKIRIYSYYRGPDETNAAYSTNCTALGTQSLCSICPADNGNVCLSECRQNQYGANCTSCNPLCGHCTGSLQTDCVYCSRNFSSSNALYSETYGNCSCASGFYYNSSTNACEACNSLCTECFGPTNGDCLTCNASANFYPDTICVSNCSDPLVVQGGTSGFYQDMQYISGQNLNICRKCHPACSQCTGANDNQCQACQTGYFLQGTTCINTCGAGLYPNFTSLTCNPCNSHCATCTGPTSHECLTCSNSALVQQSGTCQANCNNGYYPDVNNTCQPCNPACASCTAQYTTTCSACTSGFYLQWLGFSCLNSCPNGTYADNTTNQCLLCQYSCLTCSGSGPDQCIECAPNFLRSGSLCVTSCAPGEYVVNGTCMTCDPKCSTCYGIYDNECYSCADNTVTGLGYYYLNNSCLATCPAGYYPDDFKKACIPCNPVCSQCTSATYCTQCIEGPYKLNSGECTYFTCLSDQYRAITPQLACYSCDSTCLTCQGYSSFDCLTCPASSDFVAQQCLTCSQQPGMEPNPNPGNSTCVEICGDGFNYGFVQCDDGNLINGDGCSSKCTIEQGWACTPGNKYTASVCWNIQNPVPSIALVNSDNQIYIQFSKQVYLQNTLNSSNLQVSVSGPSAPYSFDWTLQSQYQYVQGFQTPTQLIVIDMTFYQTLLGNNNEKVTLTFLNSTIFIDSSGNGILTNPLSSSLSAFTYINPATAAALNSAGSSSMTATIVAIAINLGISLVFGGSISAMWTMVNTIQLVSLLPLCDVNWPQISIIVFQKMLSSQGESTFIPNIFYDDMVGKPGSGIQIEPALNSRFSSYGWNVSNFLYLSGRKILIWVAILVAWPFVYYMKSKYANKHVFCRIWNTAEEKFRYTLLLRGMLMSYVSMYLAFILNIYQMKLSTLPNIISVFIAIAFGLLLTFLPIQFMNILQRNYEKINSEKFQQEYSTIIKEVDTSHTIRYMYYPVFLIRRAVFAILLVILAGQPLYQIIAMSFTALVMLIYIVVIRPQKQLIMMVLTAAGEGLLLFLHLFSIVFLNPNLDQAKANQYGWFVVVLVGLYIVINWGIIMGITIVNLRQNYRNWKAKQVEVKKKLKEDEDYKRWKKKRHVKKRMAEEMEKQAMLEQLEEEQLRLDNERRMMEEEEHEGAEPPRDAEGPYVLMPEEHQAPNAMDMQTMMNDPSVFGTDNAHLVNHMVQQQELQMVSSLRMGSDKYQSFLPPVSSRQHPPSNRYGFPDDQSNSPLTNALDPPNPEAQPVTPSGFEDPQLVVDDDGHAQNDVDIVRKKNDQEEW